MKNGTFSTILIISFISCGLLLSFFDVSNIASLMILFAMGTVAYILLKKYVEI